MTFTFIRIRDNSRAEGLTNDLRIPGEAPPLPFELVVVSNTPLTPLKDLDEVSLMLLTQIGYIPKGYDPKTDARTVRESVPYRLFVESNVEIAMENYRKTVDHVQKLSEQRR